MKTKTLLSIIAIVLLVAIILMVLVYYRQKAKASPKGKGSDALTDKLTGDIWIGLSIDMPGLQCPVTDRFEGGLTLIFQADGSYQLVQDDQSRSGRWTIKGDKLSIRGQGIKTEAHLADNFLSRKDPYLYFQDIENYSVSFSSQSYLDQLPAILDDYQQKRDKELEAWLKSLEADLTSCTRTFQATLKSHKFEKFERLELTEAEKAASLEKYFMPILSLGLQHTSWSYGYHLDADRILAGYEIYEFNLKLDRYQEDLAEDKTALVPLEELENFISRYLTIYDDSDGSIVKDPLKEMLWASDRYDSQAGGLRMQVIEDLDADFQVELLEAWQSDMFGGLLVIHVLYETGDQDQDHACFLLEGINKDHFYYKAGSAYEPMAQP